MIRFREDAPLLLISFASSGFLGSLAAGYFPAAFGFEAITFLGIEWVRRGG